MMLMACIVGGIVAGVFCLIFDPFNNDD